MRTVEPSIERRGRSVVVPWWRDDWEIFALEGGRGVGKTLCGATAVIEHLRAVGKRARVGIGAPTNTDVRDVCIEGETGLWTLYQDEFIRYTRSLGQVELRHKNGGYVRAMGTEKPERWNGPQWSLLWFDEYALCNKAAVIDADLALRIGPKEGPWRPRMVVTFTPKGQKWVGDLMERPDVYVPRYYTRDGKPRRPTTFDNPYLPNRRVEIWKRLFMGTRLGLRELLAIEQLGTPGAMWNPDIIHTELDSDKWPRFLRVVIAVDPAGTSARRTADENATSIVDKMEGRTSAQTAICVKALGIDQRIYTLAWVADRWTPNQWASKAIELFRMFRADRIVAERNYGGDMVESTIRNVWPDAPIELVTATRGKDVRAEPVVALYEQGREIHCYPFPEAEHQLCSFKNAKENEGADYVDSGVWATWNLMGWENLDFGIGNVVGTQSDLVAFLIN